jgi:hypothetical protein
MPYTPPAGNAVNFNFSGAYTPPLGNAVNLNFTPGGYTFNLDPGSYAISGTAVALRYGRRFVLASGVYAISGTAVALRRGYTMSVTPGVYSISGSAVSLIASRYLPAAPGVYAINGTAVSLRFGRLLTVAPGVYVLSGSAVALRYGHAINAVPGVYTITGIGPTLLWKHILRVTPGVYTQVGSSVAALRTPDQRCPRRLQLSGKSIIFDYHEVTKISADPGVYTLVGGDVTFIYDRRTVDHAGDVPDPRACAAAHGRAAADGSSRQLRDQRHGGRTEPGRADAGRRQWRVPSGRRQCDHDRRRRMSLAGGTYALTGAARSFWRHGAWPSAAVSTRSSTPRTSRPITPRTAC